MVPLDDAEFCFLFITPDRHRDFILQKGRARIRVWLTYHKPPSGISYIVTILGRSLIIVTGHFGLW